MAWLRSRKLKTGTYLYVVTKRGEYIPAGKQRDVAKEILAEADRIERLERIGKKPDPVCSWTLGELRDRDLKDARARGKEIPSRTRRWRGIVTRYGAGTLLDALTPAAIESEATRRLESGVGPGTINRDRSLLRSALALARVHVDVSGFVGDPFVGVRPLKELAARRETPALTEETAERLIEAAWELAGDPPKNAKNLRPGEWAQNAAIVELLYRTSSRTSQVLQLKRSQLLGEGLLRFPPHKGGRERIFRIPPHAEKFILQASAGSPWVFPGRGDGPREGFRRFWRALCAKMKLSGVTPRALRTSAATVELEAGANLADLQRRLGHGSPQMAARFYAKTFPKVLRAVGSFHLGARVASSKGTKKRKKGKRPISQNHRVATGARRRRAS